MTSSQLIKERWLSSRVDENVLSDKLSKTQGGHCLGLTRLWDEYLGAVKAKIQPIARGAMVIVECSYCSRLAIN